MLLMASAVCSTSQDSSAMVAKFVGKGSYVFETFTESEGDRYLRPRVAYLHSEPITRQSLLGDIPVTDELVFILTYWHHGMRSRTKMAFRIKTNSKVPVMVNVTDTHWYFFSDTKVLPYQVMLNNTHLVLANGSETLTFEHQEITSPYYLLVFAVAVGVALYILLPHHGYLNTRLHPIARTLLSVKFVALLLMTMLTALATLELLHSIVFTIVLSLGGLIVVMFALAVATTDFR